MNKNLIQGKIDVKTSIEKFLCEEKERRIIKIIRKFYFCKQHISSFTYLLLTLNMNLYALIALSNTYLVEQENEEKIVDR